MMVVATPSKESICGTIVLSHPKNQTNQISPSFQVFSHSSLACGLIACTNASRNIIVPEIYVGNSFVAIFFRLGLWGLFDGTENSGVFGAYTRVSKWFLDEDWV